MIKTILYFHGFASSSNSNKAIIFKEYISSLDKDIKVIIPDLNNDFKYAVEEIKQLIDINEKPIAFIGSSLGGYYAAYFSSLHNSKAVLINPATPPLKGFDIHLGKNENYSTGEKFTFTSHAELSRFKYQRYIKRYLNTIASIDESVGSLLDYLDNENLYFFFK